MRNQIRLFLTPVQRAAIRLHLLCSTSLEEEVGYTLPPTLARLVDPNGGWTRPELYALQRKWFQAFEHTTHWFGRVHSFSAVSYKRYDEGDAVRLHFDTWAPCPRGGRSFHHAELRLYLQAPPREDGRVLLVSAPTWFLTLKAPGCLCVAPGGRRERAYNNMGRNVLDMLRTQGWVGEDWSKGQVLQAMY